MFAPSRNEVRDFFSGAWRKSRASLPLTPLEAMAVDIIQVHPEYHAVLELVAPEQGEFSVEEGKTNPFLHLSLHLAIEEQLSIDQPPGLCAEFNRLMNTCADRHAALHEVLECLGETIWRSQRNQLPPDTAAYLDCVRRRAR